LRIRKKCQCQKLLVLNINYLCLWKGYYRNDLSTI